MGKALINKHFAGLYNGVSQQAPTLRLETQAEQQINGWSSLVYGLMTRPPSRFISELSTAGNSKSLFHSINRDSSEKYIVGFHNDSSITVYGLDGTEYPVTGVAHLSSYISTTNPKRDLAVTTIADYTFIVNKTVTVELDDTLETTSTYNPATFTVYLGPNTGNTYEIQIDGSTVASALSSYVNAEGETINRDRSEILKELRDGINANTGLSATYVDNNSFTFRKINGSGFTVALSGNLTGSYVPASATNILYDNVAYIYVAKGVAEQNYRVYINKVNVASYASGKTDNASSYKTDVIASNLYTQLAVLSGYAVELKGSVIKIWRRDGKDFDFYTHDSWGDVALKGFKGQAQAFSDLPAKCFDGAVLQIVGKTDSEEGSYWVKYTDSYVRDGAEVSTTGVWKESREPAKRHKFNNRTMPIQLVRKQDLATYKTTGNPYGIYFELEPCLWAEREVGDENSAPTPSFVGGTISDIFLFNNRLGVLSGQSVCLTKTGDFFNFFPSTVTDVLDDDPIDIDAPSTEVTTLSHAVPSRDHLMIFADTQQFILSAGGEALTSKTAYIVNILSYPCDNMVTPITIGQMAYFTSPRGDYMGLREYFIQPDSLVAEAPNVAEHVPTLIPKSADGLSMCGIPNEDMILIHNGTNKVYVYKFNWSGDNKTQSSWSVWEFGRAVNAICEFDNRLYIIYSDKSLEKIELVKDLSINYVDCFRKVSPNTAIYGALGMKIYDVNGNVIQDTFSGALSFNTDVYIGYPYTFTYEFSPLYVKGSDEMLGDVETKAIYRRARVFLEGSTSFKLRANNKASDNVKLEYDYKSPNKTGTYDRSFLIKGDCSKTTVEIKSTSSRPVMLQSVSFEILVAQRSQRV